MRMNRIGLIAGGLLGVLLLLSSMLFVVEW
jgi:hypothetical protein